LNVQNSNIGLVLLDQFLGSFAIAGFSHDLDITGNCQNLTDACPDDSVIVGK
jgi:hypothetical protein